VAQEEVREEGAEHALRLEPRRSGIHGGEEVDEELRRALVVHHRWKEDGSTARRLANTLCDLGEERRGWV
jgi:hypothetical protein